MTTAALKKPLDELPQGLVGMNADLQDLWMRLHTQIQAVRELGPVNGSFDEQENIDRELCTIASDLRRWFDPAYAKRLDAQKPARKSIGMGDRRSAVLDGRSTGGGEK